MVVYVGPSGNVFQKEEKGVIAKGTQKQPGSGKWL